ncbi:flagellar protein export ATPase FliI [Parasulfuritortus cantonensis]|uniref:Flagellum-specific ATP synthase n=1 Tax=Parasulfuritortus cantonensis TaxID=2528202 RepID=A0A4R1BGS8_9PROT|nr:flagellar protein export ATPase FliI [Parasulfuritortus cantonensis]TCJ16288.1 flagellar protein export ATPase FliI [Parasulfuritortus cantonensis]
MAGVRAEAFAGYLRDCQEAVAQASPWGVTGRLTKVAGLVMEASGIKLPTGVNCKVYMPEGQQVDAEVVGFHGDRLYLMPSTDVYGLGPGAIVEPYRSCNFDYPRIGIAYTRKRRIEDRIRQVAVGPEMLGRVVDGVGRVLDRQGGLEPSKRVPLYSRPFNPMEREPIKDVLDVGIRAINALLTVGRGQRMGLFAGSGVGKSMLLGMMARYTSADVVVVGLIGERGREVKEFIENILGDEGLRRAAVVAAPADSPPLQRLHGAAYATAIAEYFRDQGLNVLLIMDSLTRYAQAQREIALAVGEPPATKGYPPSVFAKLPQLVERAGNGRPGTGSITAFYTVLVEGDDQQDPIADAARAILDGHIVLARHLADQGHYPAIDIEQSISRVITELLGREQLAQVRRFRSLYARYQRSRDLITIGAYAKGNDAQLDEAIGLYPRMEAFLMQDFFDRENYQASREQLSALLA